MRSNLLRHATTFALAIACGLLILSSDAEAQMAPPAYFCCSMAGKCPMPGPSMPGQLCYCATPYGPAQGTTCY